jgi:hypothetical protein
VDVTEVTALVVMEGAFSSSLHDEMTVMTSAAITVRIKNCFFIRKLLKG